jgi:hypothetical protein
MLKQQILDRIKAKYPAAPDYALDEVARHFSELLTDPEALDEVYGLDEFICIVTDFLKLDQKRKIKKLKIKK